MKEGYITAFVEDTTFTVSSIIRDVLKTSPLLPTEHYIGPIFKVSSEYKSALLAVGNCPAAIKF